MTFLRQIHSRLNEIIRKVDEGENLTPEEDDFLEDDKVQDLYRSVATETDDNEQ